MENMLSTINVKELASIMPSCMMHCSSNKISTSILSNNAQVISDRISDTYISELSDGTISLVHCSHFRCKLEEDFERLNHECFVNMISQFNEKQLEEVKNVNNVNAISDLFVYKSKKYEVNENKPSAQQKTEQFLHPYENVEAVHGHKILKHNKDYSAFTQFV